MTEHDRAAFGRMLFALGDTFNEPVSELRVEAYFDALRDLPAGAVLAAGRRAIAESEFFPRPFKLRELAEGSGDDRAELAWNAVRKLIKRYGYYEQPPLSAWPDEAARRAAMELYGGWRALCSSLPADGPELLGYRKSFIASYQAYAGRERRELALPAAPVLGYLEGE
jgi:hypothetical protein